MNKKLTALILLLLYLSIVYGQVNDVPNIQYELQNFLNYPEFKNANIGIQVVDLNSEKKLINYQPDKSLTPASIQKIIVTSTALEVFGPEHKFKTSIQYDGHIVNNTLYGNIYIKGSGDPTLYSTYFKKSFDILESWAIKIKSLLSITNIKGDIIGDASLLPFSINDKWLWEDIGNYYGASANALSYHDNTYYIYLQSKSEGTLTNILSVVPSDLNLTFNNQVIASKEDKDNAYIYGDLNCKSRKITGSIPQNHKRFRIKGSLPDPALLVAQKLKKVLEKQAITVEGEAKSLYEENNYERKKIFHHQSESLTDIIKITNEESINLYAELLLHHVGLALGNDASIDSSAVSMKKYWDSKGFDTEGIFIYDGSGLSPFNAMPASFFTKLLIYMYKYSNYKDEFMNSLAIAGKEGTLKWFGKSPPMFDNLLAKSGSMTKVLAYTGYLETQQKKKLVFTIIVNNYTGKYENMKYIINTFLDKIYLLY